MATTRTPARIPALMLWALVWVSVWVSVWALVWAAPAIALANPVNAEQLRPNPLSHGSSGGFDASVALARGNIDLLDVGAGGRVEYLTLHPADPGALPFIHQRLFSTSSVRFAERERNAFINQAFVHARWIGMWHRRVGTDLFAQYGFNEFLRLTARAVAGGGVRIEAVHRQAWMIWGGSGYMVEYNRIRVAPGAADPPETVEHRWTSYLAVRLAVFEDRLLIQNTLYVQPRFVELGDLRVLEVVEALAKFDDHFALGATFSVSHDSAPPTAVERTDLRLATTLRLSF